MQLIFFHFQILNIVAVVLAEAFASQSRGDEKQEEKDIYIVVII